MKIFQRLFLLLILSSFLISCSVEPRDIDYGQDHCTLCDMTVVDKTHGAEYVTKKGKAYTFDSVECLVRKINQENNEEQLAFILVDDYNRPGVLINAKDAFYLISEKIKSPMGANLSAFASKEAAEKAKSQYGGKVYSWLKIKNELK